MNNKGKLALLAFAAMLIGLVVWAVRTTPPTPVPQEPKQASKTMKYSNNTIKEESNGKIIWEMTAEEIEVDNVTQDVTFKKLSGKFYQTNGTVVSVEAPQGVSQAKEKILKLDGGVKTATSDGAKMDTQTLQWNSASAMLTGEGNVTITKEDVIAVGDKIESADGFQNFKLMGNAHITKGRAQE